ncbi:MAG: GntR family transcriptional regulator [Erysipelotrichaceae bacterium]|nr:GntR family transcriptional regulator [Erysipelotrichaceae bacterium]
MSDNIFENVKHGSLSTQIFELLRDRILNGDYEDGQKLNELALAKELKISRTPIREALKQLELQELVESIPNKGVYVKGFSARDIDDMFEMRISLEGLAIELAIDRMDDEHLNKIKDVYDLMEFYSMKLDYEKLRELNIMFHEVIYEATQSPYFMQILKDIHYYVSMTSRHAIRQKDRVETSLSEHKVILDKIIAADKEGAREVIESHIRKTQQFVRDYFLAHPK